MNIHIEHEVSRAIALVPAEDCGRLSSQLGRLRTLDVSGFHARIVQMLELVVRARMSDVGGLDRCLERLGPLTPAEAASIEQWLRSVPEARSASYEQWLEGFLVRVHALERRRRHGTLTVVVVAALVAGLVAALAASFRGSGGVPAPVDATACMREMLQRLDRGQVVRFWDGLPRPVQDEVQRVWGAVARELDEGSLDRLKQIDLWWANVLRDCPERMRDSGPSWARSGVGMDDAVETLARYFDRRSKSRLYSASWLRGASFREVLLEATGGLSEEDWEVVWRSALREDVLMAGFWGPWIGLGSTTPLEVLGADWSVEAASTGVVRIGDSKGWRVDVAMTSVPADERTASPDCLAEVPASMRSDEILATMRDIASLAPERRMARDFLEALREHLRPERLKERIRALQDAHGAKTAAEFSDAIERAMGRR
jgi:hypothetical protein